jgi:hypothetical protein
MRRERTIVLNENQTIADLDLWPGDEVILAGTWQVLGYVTMDGVFVALGE